MLWYSNYNFSWCSFFIC